jgi:hypothetical protein
MHSPHCIDLNETFRKEVKASRNKIIDGYRNTQRACPRGAADGTAREIAVWSGCDDEGGTDFYIPFPIMGKRDEDDVARNIAGHVVLCTIFLLNTLRASVFYCGFSITIVKFNIVGKKSPSNCDALLKYL